MSWISFCSIFRNLANKAKQAMLSLCSLRSRSAQSLKIITFSSNDTSYCLMFCAAPFLYLSYATCTPSKRPEKITFKMFAQKLAKLVG